MVNTNKILTVSYGTFSCTLEGFDDSFDMMKDIAEYFRDLAADDRFFGAEPPTPDAEMLARIAEHKAARQVEARKEGSAIVLRPTANAEPEVAEDAVQSESAPETAAAAPAAPVEAAEPSVAQTEITPEEAEAEIVEPDAQPVAKASPQFDDDSVAAKLSRIRAVVNRNTEAAPEADYLEDEHAEDLIDKTDENLPEDRDEDVVQATTPSSSETMDAILREAESVAEEEYEPIQEPEADETAPAAESVEDPQLAEDIAASTDGTDESQERPKGARPARVIRMKREAFEAAVADGQIEAEAEAPADEDGLSPDEEEDLLRELAEVEAELNLTRLSDSRIGSDEEEDEGEVDSIFAEPKPEAPAKRAEAPAADGAGQTDVSRLMDKAAQEMDRPEGAHRRSAIAHLRAAVEATRAETEAGGGLGRGDDSLDAYRDDLNSVVRPRRPRSAPAQPESGRRPVAKPAPLKLVAEQRVDTPEQPQPRVVRPRRVSLDDDAPQEVSNENAQETAGSFAEFAEQVGVKDLSDVMEAAAAYMSYVEGRQKFSRPQLMNKARQIEEYAFSREDGLRSFGQLLRAGKIEKLKGGRFTVSDELIGFKPDARAVG